MSDSCSVHLVPNVECLYKMSVNVIIVSFICTTGLETVHQMTSEGRWELRVDLGDYLGDTAFATYSGFSLAAESDFYRLHFDKFTGGTAGKPSGLNQWNLGIRVCTSCHADILGGKEQLGKKGFLVPCYFALGFSGCLFLV